MAALALVILLTRLPTLVQPAGGDQGLYAYAGARILEGATPYVDVWDQKPPGIQYLYAALLFLWPHESVVPLADLLATVAIAWMLILLGRYRFTESVGFGAAFIFVVFGNPAFQRMSGMYSRAQCEPFISVAVLGALLLIGGPVRTRYRLVIAGALVGFAFLLKYNAAAYGLLTFVAAWAWQSRSETTWKSLSVDGALLAGGFLIPVTTVVGVLYFQGALKDLWLATIEYNLQYSEETYASASAFLKYLVTLGPTRASTDMIWFLGGIGLLSAALAVPASTRRAFYVVVVWLAAAHLSIAVNGQRNLPNYFVQAFPALALAASLGFSGWRTWRFPRQAVVGTLLLVGCWRVGADAPVLGMRWGGLPGIADNLAWDIRRAVGTLDRETYLARFGGVKHDPLQNARLAEFVKGQADADTVFVFGFSGGSVGWLSGRPSPTRFFWSHPVLIEFASHLPGYGSRGLLRDLQERPPDFVALQEEQWHSRTFFLSQPDLRHWLEENYSARGEIGPFRIWASTARSDAAPSQPMEAR